MTQIRQIPVALIILLALTAYAYSGKVASIYTKLNLDTDCMLLDGITEEEAEQGGILRCKGYGTYPIYIKYGDLRESVHFGNLSQPFIDSAWESFNVWNSANTTFEWRLKKGKPMAVIHRAFLDNIDPETGGASKKLQGQVLVVSSVATEENKGIGCVIGLVDARANKDANTLARTIADEIEIPATCTTDGSLYRGTRGPTAGSMSRSYPYTSQ
ncbi:MAG: hypothetical protein ABJL18_11435 [Hyphomicrobiales bacterium]